VKSGAQEDVACEGTSTEWDAIILGAGISGLVSAQILLAQGLTRILVIDGYRHVGGNHLDSHIGPFTFDLGSLIFFENTPFFEYFPELVTDYVPIEISLGRLTPAGRISTYPISVKDDVLAAGLIEISLLICSFLKARLFSSRPKNAAEFARYWIGHRFFHSSGLSSYMERFYGVAAEQIELDFAEKRMTWISDAAAIKPRIKKLFVRSPPYKKVRALVRPQSGFAVVYSKAQASLEARGVRFILGTEIDGIAKQPANLMVTAGDQRFVSSRVIGTIPLRKMLGLAKIADAPELMSVALASLFFSFSGKRGFSHCILYNFTNSGRWKRLTMFSDFYGPRENREYFTVEVNMRSADEPAAELVEDFLRDVSDKGLFAGDLRSEGTRITGSAYPVYTKGATHSAEDAIARLRSFGVEAHGRQGGFDYLQSTVAVTHAVRAALAAR
jgi:protoporphyrinogen oxidase